MIKKYPPPIISTEPGTWAHSTVSQRLPKIASRVIEENQFSEGINEELLRLGQEIQSGSIRPPLDQGAPDQSSWESYARPYIGQSWLEVPWFFVEHYFYRRILEAVQYFQLGLDPFGYQKEQGLEKSREDILSLGRFLDRSLKDRTDPDETLRKGIYFSLWGNQADLSLWPADSKNSPKYASQQSLQDHLLANDIERVIGALRSDRSPLPRVDLMLDNAGFELVTDLGLAELLLGFNLAARVVLHAKAFPTFVSDVIPGDVDTAVDFLSAQTDQEIRDFGARLDGYIQAGRLRIESRPFWNSPLPLWELPDDLLEEWKLSSLVISKGDANYRRILGDLQWDFTLSFEQAVDYLPVPLAALRTLKAELAVGLDRDRIQDAADQDPNWLVDGRWGVIHYAGGYLS